MEVPNALSASTFKIDNVSKGRLLMGQKMLMSHAQWHVPPGGEVVYLCREHGEARDG